MFYKHNYKKEEEEEKEKGFIQKIQKIRDMDMYTVILIIVPIILILLLGSYAVFIFRTNKKAVDIKPQTIVQSQILSKEKFDKKDVYLNETAKLNSKNFELFISEKDPNTGLFLIRPSDIISKRDKIVLSYSVKTIEISASEEILKNIKWSLSDNFKKINITPNSITIELNRKENTVFSFNLKNLELLGEYLNSNSPLLSVTYTESYTE